MSTVGQIVAAVSGGQTVACCKCHEPVEPEDALQVTLQLTVEHIATWARGARPETTAAVIAPVCPGCKDKVVPAAGQELRL